MDTNTKSPEIITHSCFINWWDMHLVQGAVIFWLGAEMAPMLDILPFHLWKLGCPCLLLFLGALPEIELESRSGCVDCLPCWWKEDEVPHFLVLCSGVNSEVISKSGQRQAPGLCPWVVLLGFHSGMDIL